MYQNEYEQYLAHYGVPGMKWGVRRSLHKARVNERYRKRALKYDIKQANMTKKSERIHAERDLGRSNKAAIKSAKYSKKAAKVLKKSLNEGNDFVKSKLEKKAAKLNYKSTQQQMKANRLSKQTGYGVKAMKYSIKSDKAAAKAAKARMKIANNEAYIAKTKKKVNTLSPEELQRGAEYIKRLQAA